MQKPARHQPDHDPNRSVRPDGITGLCRRLHGDERGATATEYIVLLVLVASFIIAIVALFGEQLERLYAMAVDTLYRDVGNKY